MSIQKTEGQQQQDDASSGRRRLGAGASFCGGGSVTLDSGNTVIDTEMDIPSGEALSGTVSFYAS